MSISPEMRETEGTFCGKNLGMEMSLFLCGNSAAWKWAYLCTEFCGNLGKIMYICIYVSLIGNGTWKNGRHPKFKQS